MFIGAFAERSSETTIPPDDRVRMQAIQQITPQIQSIARAFGADVSETMRALGSLSVHTNPPRGSGTDALPQVPIPQGQEIAYHRAEVLARRILETGYEQGIPNFTNISLASVVHSLSSNFYPSSDAAAWIRGTAQSFGARNSTEASEIANASYILAGLRDQPQIARLAASVDVNGDERLMNITSQIASRMRVSTQAGHVEFSLTQDDRVALQTQFSSQQQTTSTSSSLTSAQVAHNTTSGDPQFLQRLLVPDEHNHRVDLTRDAVGTGAVAQVHSLLEGSGPIHTNFMSWLEAYRVSNPSLWSNPHAETSSINLTNPETAIDLLTSYVNVVRRNAASGSWSEQFSHDVAGILDYRVAIRNNQVQPYRLSESDPEARRYMEILGNQSSLPIQDPLHVRPHGASDLDPEGTTLIASLTALSRRNGEPSNLYSTSRPWGNELDLDHSTFARYVSSNPRRSETLSPQDLTAIQSTVRNISAGIENTSTFQTAWNHGQILIHAWETGGRTGIVDALRDLQRQSFSAQLTVRTPFQNTSGQRVSARSHAADILASIDGLQIPQTTVSTPQSVVAQGSSVVNTNPSVLRSITHELQELRTQYAHAQHLEREAITANGERQLSLWTRARMGYIRVSETAQMLLASANETQRQQIAEMSGRLAQMSGQIVAMASVGAGVALQSGDPRARTRALGLIQNAQSFFALNPAENAPYAARLIPDRGLFALSLTTGASPLTLVQARDVELVMQDLNIQRDQFADISAAQTSGGLRGVVAYLSNINQSINNSHATQLLASLSGSVPRSTPQPVVPTAVAQVRTPATQQPATPVQVAPSTSQVQAPVENSGPLPAFRPRRPITFGLGQFQTDPTLRPDTTPIQEPPTQQVTVAAQPVRSSSPVPVVTPTIPEPVRAPPPPVATETVRPTVQQPRVAATRPVVQSVRPTPAPVQATPPPVVVQRPTPVVPTVAVAPLRSTGSTSPATQPRYSIDDALAGRVPTQQVAGSVVVQAASQQLTPQQANNLEERLRVNNYVQFTPEQLVTLRPALSRLTTSDNTQIRALIIPNPAPDAQNRILQIMRSSVSSPNLNAEALGAVNRVSAQLEFETRIRAVESQISALMAPAVSGSMAVGGTTSNLSAPQLAERRLTIQPEIAAIVRDVGRNRSLSPTDTREFTRRLSDQRVTLDRIRPAETPSRTVTRPTGPVQLTPQIQAIVDSCNPESGDTFPTELGTRLMRLRTTMQTPLYNSLLDEVSTISANYSAVQRSTLRDLLIRAEQNRYVAPSTTAAPAAHAEIPVQQPQTAAPQTTTNGISRNTSAVGSLSAGRLGALGNTNPVFNMSAGDRGAGGVMAGSRQSDQPVSEQQQQMQPFNPNNRMAISGTTATIYIPVRDGESFDPRSITPTIGSTRFVINLVPASVSGSQAYTQPIRETIDTLMRSFTPIISQSSPDPSQTISLISGFRSQLNTTLTRFTDQSRTGPLGRYLTRN